MLLCVIFVVLSIIFTFMYFSYQQKAEANQVKIQETEQRLANLQYLATLPEEENGADSNLFAQKSFVGYDEVIPFIAMLESLFSLIDPKAEITIKSREEEIFIDHFADYAIDLKMNNKKDLFFKALDELYNSRFITKITSFTMQYKVPDGNSKNEFNEIELVVRLYLN
jgi:hypothetical protein